MFSISYWIRQKTPPECGLETCLIHSWNGEISHGVSAVSWAPVNRNAFINIVVAGCSCGDECTGSGGLFELPVGIETVQARTNRDPAGMCVSTWPAQPTHQGLPNETHCHRIGIAR